ncbi:hypothetical protein EI94DRAFT_1737848 [Lactarius quietus]|nr:hypothetical protein EI94DRAFT_1737848 [Lactarius quietus]
MTLLYPWRPQRLPKRGHRPMRSSKDTGNRHERLSSVEAGSTLTHPSYFIDRIPACSSGSI